MRWRFWLMMSLLLCGGIGLLPNQSMPQGQWQTPASVIIPMPASSVTQFIAPPTTSMSSSHVESAVAADLPASVTLDLGRVTSLVAAEQAITRLYAKNLHAYYTREAPPFENSYHIWVGPYWSAMDAKADVRSLPALLSSAQIVSFLN